MKNTDNNKNEAFPDDITGGHIPTPAPQPAAEPWQIILFDHLQGTTMADPNQMRPHTPEPLEPYEITAATDGTPPPAALYIGEARVLSVGDLAEIVGPPKERKTLFCTGVANALLTGSHKEHITTDLPAPRLLYIDTEQSGYHAKRTFDRVTEGAEAKDLQRLKYYAFRELSPVQRLHNICRLIAQNRPDVTIVDGLADLMTDTNNKVDSGAVVGVLMAMATEYNTAIAAVLHTTAANGKKGQGHAGSEMERKAETVISVTKDPDTNGATSKVVAQYTRNRSFAPLSITQDGETGVKIESLEECQQDNGQRLVKWVIDHINGQPDAPSDYTAADLLPLMEAAAAAYRMPYSDRTARRLIQQAEARGQLIRSNAQHSKNGKWYDMRASGKEAQR